MRWLFTMGCLLAAMGAVASAAEQPGRPSSFAIRGARLVPVSSPPLENATITFRDGLITAVGAGAAAPAGAWVIDGKGWTVYPGLIDALTSIGLSGKSPQNSSNGDSQQEYSEGPEDRPATRPGRVAAAELRPSDEQVRKWREAGFTTAVVAPRDGYFAGQASIVNLAGDDPGGMVVEPRAAVLVSLEGQQGYRGFPNSLMGRIAYIRQTFADAQHLREARTVYGSEPRGRKRPLYDAALEPLAQALKDGLPVLYPGNRAREVDRAIAMAAELPVPLIVYGAQGAYRAAGALADAGLPAIVNVDWPQRPKERDPEDEEPLRTLRFREQAPSTPGALRAKGVPIAFSSGGISEPGGILASIRRAIEKGLSEQDALEALTLGAARIFGAGDRLGSLETGKIANLVVTDGDLFAPETRIRMVFVDGRKFDIPEPKPEQKKSEDEPPGRPEAPR